MTKGSWKPGWHSENRSPVFITQDGDPSLYHMYAQHGGEKYLWGNVPALDVLNLERNEADKLPKKLHLLFAGGLQRRSLIFIADCL